MVEKRQNIRDIVDQWLRANGYDGLAGEECGCECGDLMPCDDPNIDNCVPGHKIPCPTPDDCEYMFGCTTPNHWHMVEGKKQ